MRKAPVLDDASVSRLCIQLLDRLRINIALCTEYDEVLYATKRTKEIMRRFPGAASFRTGDPLPAELRDAARAYLERREAEGDGARESRRRAPVKLTTPDGAIDVYVSATAVHELPPIALIVRLTDERVKLGEVLELMRGRYKLSARDLRLLRSVAEQRNLKEIAAANALTYGTTKVYLHDLYRRLDVHSRDGLLRLMDRVRRSR
ncbi:MAG TPA: LuxR C-terminal-related transcriptional regulator [Polyangia bacterium]|nr:LuxR C-terminal-related transcriptional regulator [Polyangia bacterium]